VTDSVEAAAGVYLGSFAIAVVSGVVPIVNAELYLIGIVLAIGGIPEALVLAVLIAAGQMIGKGALYQAARGATRLGASRAARLADKLDHARAKVGRWRSKPYSALFVSASVGLPPLYLVTLVAGILEIRFRAFLLVGFAGRTLRFGTIGVLAALGSRAGQP
jgi:membrane protein YqaA with SNARE-associated domain